MENNTLMTDFYELTMAQTYFNNRGDEEVIFDIFFRKNPFNGGFTISGGLDSTIEYIKNFKITEEDINYLRSLNTFSEEFLSYLRTMKFNGSIYSVPDGEVVFPNEPVITIKANILEAQILETALLSNFNHGSLVVTASKRITKAAKNIPVMEFGARRARGIASAIEASKLSYIGGCVGTSNVKASQKYGINVLGTMAHSLVEEADNEYQAFLEYAKSNPYNCVFLIDTIDTLKSGLPNAIKVAKEFLIPNGYKFKGVRIDSGDLSYLSKEVRRILDENGFKDTQICLSNGLDEYTITSILNEGAKVDSFGVGDNISASKERIGGVYKLSGVIKNGKLIPKIKISNDTIKTTIPGYKKVYRFYDNKTGYALGDVITLFDEVINGNTYTLVHPTEIWKHTTITNYTVKELQKPIFIDGKLVYDDPSLKEKQAFCEQEYNTLYPEITRLTNPHQYYVDLSNELRNLKNELIEASKVKVKKLEYK